MKDHDRFMTYVTMHERAWGLDTYKGRPTLKQILEAKVVAFWYPTSKELPFTLTIHNDLKEIDAYLRALIIHTKVQVPRLRLARVYVNKQEVKFKTVQIVWQRPPKMPW